MKKNFLKTQKNRAILERNEVKKENVLLKRIIFTIMKSQNIEELSFTLAGISKSTLGINIDENACVNIVITGSKDE